MIHHKSYPMCNHTYQCTHYEKPILTVKTIHPSNQEVVYYNLHQINRVHKLIVNNLSSYKELITCIIYATPNAPKLCAMQAIWVEYLNQYQCIQRMDKRKLSLIFVISCLAFKGSILIIGTSELHPTIICLQRNNLMMILLFPVYMQVIFFIVGLDTSKIDTLKRELSKLLTIKSLGAAKQMLDMKLSYDKRNGNLCLSQED